MSKEELGGASARRDRKPPLALAEDSRDRTASPLPASTSRVPRNPHEIPDVENLDLGHVLQARDGALYRKENS